MALTTATAALADAPERVVSINLCTDQLALLLAAPGQVVSVSRLSHDQASSAMADTARALPANGSRAEEIYLLGPDLVVAGVFNDPATVAMLRDLGIAVEIFAPATSLGDVRDRLAQMGAALGRADEAARQIADFDASLAAMGDAPATRPRIALYHVNGYTSGDRTLSGAILNAAGFDNIATEVGLGDGGTLPLEQLVMRSPDVIVTGTDYPGQARGEEVLAHPALRALGETRFAAGMTSRDWVCGTPHVLNAVRDMRALRLSLERAP